MSRPKSKNVFYFPHYTKNTIEQDLIEHKHGAEGYRAYFRLFELVADADYHRLSIASEDEKLMFDLGMNGDSNVIEDVIRILVDRERIDKGLWEKERVIWMDDFIRTLRPVWSKRGKKLPTLNEENIVSGYRNLQKRKEEKRKKKKSREQDEELLSIEEYQKRFPDIDVNNTMKKFLAYTNNPKHNDALKWLGNEKKKKTPEFKQYKTGPFEAFCSKCVNKEMPSNKWQIKAGSSCCKVEYVPLKPKF